MILALRSGRFPNANQLAELCEVSRRTIYRDLDALLRAGVPVRYRSDRQGYELGSGFFLDPPRLEEDEIAALILRASQGGLRDWPSLPRKAESAALKCAQGLSEEARRRVLSLAEIVGDETPAPEVAPARLAMHRVILEALGERRQLRLSYRQPGEEAEVATRFSTYRLGFQADAWCLIGRSSYHRQIHVLPLPWIRHAEPTDDTYQIPPRFRPGRSPSLLDTRPPADRPQIVWLRLRGIAMQELEASARPPGEVIECRLVGDGEIALILNVTNEDSLKRWVFGFGEDIEVLSPADLRRSIRETALRLVRSHSETTSVETTGEPRRGLVVSALG